MTTREQITQALVEMNEAENSHDLSAEQKSRAVDRLCSAGVQGWANGVARGGRAEERAQEAFLWSEVRDYHREFERLVIDPPLATADWNMSGRLGEDAIALTGSTTFEFNDAGRIARFWMYFNDPLG